MGTLIYLKPDKESEAQDVFQQILNDYQKKHGQPPLIIEYSRLIQWQQKVTVPQGCKLIVRAIPLPINHFLVGVTDD